MDYEYAVLKADRNISQRNEQCNVIRWKRPVWGVSETVGHWTRVCSPKTGSHGWSQRQAGPWCLMQWRPLHYKSLLKSHAAFHVYREHMGKPAIFRPQNKPLCSWTHDRTGSFLPREPHPRGVGPLTVIKPPQFSQQNRSYIKLKYRGLINKAWAGEKKNWDGHNDLQTVFPSRSWAVQSHEIHFKTWSRCLPRQRRKNRADRGWRKRPWLQRFIQMSSLDCTTMEPIPVLAQHCGMVLYLFCFSLFLIENPEATSLTTIGQK